MELFGNPWRCDCRLRALKRWLVSANVPLTEDAACSEPRRLRGKKFGALAAEEFACPPMVAPAAVAAKPAAASNGRASSSSDGGGPAVSSSGVVPRYVEAKSG